METEFRKLAGNRTDGDKAVSSVYGKIDRILFVFWQYLFPKRKSGQSEDEYTRAVMHAALEFYGPIICSLVEPCPPGSSALALNYPKLNVLFLIEFDVQLKLPFSYRPKNRPNRKARSLDSDSWMKEFPESILSDFRICNEDLTIESSTGNNASQNEAEVRTRAVRASSRRIVVDFIFMNLDFDLLAEEALSALDFKSALFNAKGTRDMNHSVQDPFIAVKRGNQVVLMDPYYAWPTQKGRRGPYTFKQVPEVLSSQTDILVKGFPFFIQGGNLLVGDDYAIVGGDIIRLNVDSYKEKEKERIQQRQRQEDDEFLSTFRGYIAQISRDGRINEGESQLLKNTISDFQKSTHGIERTASEARTPLDDDQFLNLLGRYLGVSLIRSPLCPKSDSKEHLRNLPEFFHLDTYMTLAGRNRDGKEIILIGQLFEWRKSKKRWRWRKISHKSDPMLQSMKAYLRDVADYFREPSTLNRETKVIRLPLLYHNGTLFSYNNCLVEDLHTKPNGATITEFDPDLRTRIHIPQFQSGRIDRLLGIEHRFMFEHADKKVIKRLRKHDFCVMPIHGMNLRAMAYSQVGLHCISSTLSRFDVPWNSKGIDV